MKTALKSLVVATSMVSAVAMAGTIEVKDVAGAWSQVMKPAGVDVTYLNLDGKAGNEEIRWGQPHKPANPDMKQSGYRFLGTAPPNFSVNPNEEFVLGKFTHFNWTIFGTITKARLDINLDLGVAGSNLSRGPYTFSFLHDETTNICNPQPVCANDKVTVSDFKTTDYFNVDGKMYKLTIVGFRRNGVISKEFSTFENKDNVAELIGKFTVADIPVSEPATLALFGLGLMGLGYSRRRNK